MDHTEAIRQSAVEKYLLDELGPEDREAFEGHFFTCEECAADLRMTALLMEQFKQELARPRISPVAAARPGWSGAFQALFRPAFAVPVLALLLVVVGFQNLVVFPQLKQKTALNSQPQVLPSVSLVGGGSRAAEIRTLTIAPQRPFLLFVDIPADTSFTGYQCLLYGPSGKLLWQIPLSSEQAANTVTIQVPSDSAQAGVNTLVVQGKSPNGSEVVLVKYRFLLQMH